MKLTDQQQKALDKLTKAEEKFLFELGWIKNRKHFSPPKRVAYVFLGDKVFLSSALAAQKSSLDAIKNDY